MQINCPQCGKTLEAPHPLPSLAKCPFCASVFTPSRPAESPPPLPVQTQSPYLSPGVPTMPAAAASSAGNRLTGPAVALLVTGVLWTGFATLNWVGSFNQNQQVPPLPIFQQNPELKKNFEAGIKIAPKISWIFIVMGLLVILGAVQMLRRRGYAMAITGSIVVMLPCSPCCITFLPLAFGIWSLVVLFNPEVRRVFE
jgi:hypothetical protein